jgi:hypothetical protein
LFEISYGRSFISSDSLDLDDPPSWACSGNVLVNQTVENAELLQSDRRIKLLPLIGGLQPRASEVLTELIN